mgnify:CR=1 FL=1
MPNITVISGVECDYCNVITPEREWDGYWNPVTDETICYQCRFDGMGE